MSSRNILLLILALAFILRIAGVNYALPLTVVADEPAHLYGPLQMLESRTLLPGLHPEEFLQKLYFPPYLSYLFLPFVSLVLGIWFLIVHVPLETFKHLVALDPTYLFLVARFLSALAGTGAVYFVYKAAKNIFRDEHPALLSATALAFSYLHVDFSHWGRHWSFVTLIFALVIWVLSRSDISPKYKYLSVAPLAGVGFGINYQAGIAAIFILLWFLLIDKMSIRQALKTRWVWEISVCFLVLIGIVIALYPQNLSVISPQAVVKYSADEPTGLFGFFWSYYFYFKLLLFSEPALLISLLVGLWIAYRNKLSRRFAVVSILFTVIYVAIFYLGFHLQGRYILMLYPLFAIIGGYGLWKMGKWPSVLLLSFMLLTVLRFDQLLIRGDTRTQAREWIFENVPEQTSVAVLARLARLPSTPEAITEQEKIDPGSLRKIDEAERALPSSLLPGPHYHALNLATVKGGDFFTYLPEYLRTHHYQYLVISPDFANAHDFSLDKFGYLPIGQAGPVIEFKGYDGNDDINDLSNGFGGGLPFLFSGRSNGPTIEIRKL